MHTDINGIDLIDRILDSTNFHSQPWSTGRKTPNNNKRYIGNIVHADTENNKDGSVTYTFLAAGVSKEAIAVKDVGGRIIILLKDKEIYDIKDDKFHDCDISAKLENGLFYVTVKSQKKEKLIQIS